MYWIASRPSLMVLVKIIDYSDWGTMVKGYA